jgi:hypothetical protein
MTSSKASSQDITTTVYDSTTVAETTTQAQTSTDFSTTQAQSSTVQWTTTTSMSCSAYVGISYKIQVSNSGDSSVDNTFVQLTSGPGNGKRAILGATNSSAQIFKLNSDCTFSTADGSLFAMIGDASNLHYQYFFPTVTDAKNSDNVDWEPDVCAVQNDNILSCSAMSQNVFQTDGTSLELGNQLYDKPVTLNLISV